MLLFYVRHGDPTYTPDQLTPLGHRQAEAVGKRLAQYGLDRIYASTSTRAQQTAQPVCELLKKDMTLLDFALEHHAWEQLSIVKNGRRQWLSQDFETCQLLVSDEIRTLGFRWYEHPAFAEYNYQKGVERIANATDAWLATLGYEHELSTHRYRCVNPTNERVALFAHAGFGAFFLGHLLDIPYPLFETHFALQLSSVTVIEFKNVDGYAIPRILTLSDAGHLCRDGLPAHYSGHPF